MPPTRSVHPREPSCAFAATNEQTDRGGNTLVYDAAGNLTDNGDGQKLVYDAFGRLKKVTDDFGFTIAQYRYNGAHQRIAFQYDADGDGGVEVGNNDDPWYYLVHDHNWRPVATVLAVDDGSKGGRALNSCGATDASIAHISCTTNALAALCKPAHPNAEVERTGLEPATPSLQS